MYKQAYYRGLINNLKSGLSKKAFNFGKLLQKNIGWKVGIPLYGAGLVGAYHFGDKVLSPAVGSVADMYNDVKAVTQQAGNIADQNLSGWLQQQKKQAQQAVKDLKEGAKDIKENAKGININTAGKYFLGGAGIIGGSILLGKLLSGTKKKRKKDQDQEQEA